jgi:hypothetical protein
MDLCVIDEEAVMKAISNNSVHLLDRPPYLWRLFTGRAKIGEGGHEEFGGY